MSSRIRFFGATENVTGSMTVLIINEKQYLVDCGLLQESRPDVKFNNHFPFEPKNMQAVFLTHVHLDHSGRLPLLYKAGFRGKIFLHRAGIQILKLLLEDFLKITKDEHHPFHKSFSSQDIQGVISLFYPLDWDKEIHFDQLVFTYKQAGHILGASFIFFKSPYSIIFSGDLGKNNDLIHHPVAPKEFSDYVICESTYGNKPTNKVSPEEELIEVLKEVHHKSLTLIIPSFALGKGQILLSLFEKIFKENKKLKLPLFVSSPLLQKISRVYWENTQYLRPEANEFKNLWVDAKYLVHPREIESFNKLSMPRILITGSGMLNGGRIWSHLQDLAGDPKTFLYFVGFQAPGTPGNHFIKCQQLISPQKIHLEFKGQYKVSKSFSAHAHQDELIQWLTQNMANKNYLIHGEKESKEALYRSLSALSLNVQIPQEDDVIPLENLV